jgi:hypothetical protein
MYKTSRAGDLPGDIERPYHKVSSNEDCLRFPDFVTGDRERFLFGSRFRPGPPGENTVLESVNTGI